MPNITIKFTDEDWTRILAALNYQPTIIQEDDDSAERKVKNPVSDKEHVQRACCQRLVGEVEGYERRKAKEKAWAIPDRIHPS
jgi:hypothetical protein